MVATPEPPSSKVTTLSSCNPNKVVKLSTTADGFPTLPQVTYVDVGVGADVVVGVGADVGADVDEDAVKDKFEQKLNNVMGTVLGNERYPPIVNEVVQ